MKDTQNSNSPILEDLAYWWRRQRSGKKVAFIWLWTVALIAIILGAIYPPFGLFLLILSAILGTIFAAIHLLI